MPLKNKLGTVLLPTVFPHERFTVSYDTDDGTRDVTARNAKAVILYVPDVEQPDHEHIELTDEATRQLHAWLGEYLAAKNPGYTPRQKQTDAAHVAMLVVSSWSTELRAAWERMGKPVCLLCGAPREPRGDGEGGYTGFYPCGCHEKG